MRLRSLLATSVLLVQAVALASLDTVSRQVATATGGIVQACPPEYQQAVCIRAEGTVVTVGAKIDAALPFLLPGAWRDGPEQGLSADVPDEDAVLHLIPRGDAQALAVFQPKGAASPAVTPPTITVGVVIENPENNYVVVLDSSNKPVRDLTTVRDGAYTIITSGYGRKTQTQAVTVGAEGLKTFKVPRLAVATPTPTAARLVLPSAPGYIFLVVAANGALVTDVSLLQPGYYDVFNYRDGEAGPLASSQSLQAGQPTTLSFNGAFSGGNRTMPAAVPSGSSYSTPAPSSTGGRCYVSGYTRKNGTYVSGYYRSC